MTASVVGCSNCGALYTPTAGDQGICGPCRHVVQLDPPVPASGSKPRPAPSQPVAAFKRPAGGAASARPSFLTRRSLRRIAIAAAAALLVGGLGAVAFSKRQALAGGWAAIQQHTSSAWNAIKRQASEAWLAVRRHSPIDALKPARTASAPPATPSQSALRDATASRGTHRRAPPPGKKRNRRE